MTTGQPRYYFRAPNFEHPALQRIVFVALEDSTDKDGRPVVRLLFGDEVMAETPREDFYRWTRSENSVGGGR